MLDGISFNFSFVLTKKIMACHSKKLNYCPFFGTDLGVQIMSVIARGAEVLKVRAGNPIGEARP
jgi:carbamoylphosphate synthase small subunit